MSQAPTPSCVLDWDRRSGFLAGTRILDHGRWWYALGYTTDGTPDGPLAFAAVNPKTHVLDLGQMPPESGGELIRMYQVARDELGFDLDGVLSASNIAANIGGPDSGATIPHLHIVVVGAQGGHPHSGAGLMLARSLFDRWYNLADGVVAELAALSHRWQLELDQLKAAKDQADAYRR